MTGMSDVEILRIFIGEADRVEGKPLYERIVEQARSHGMAGATVTRGIMGFGADSLVHTAKILRLSEDLPIIVEIVDAPDRIRNFLPVLEELVHKGSIVLIPGRATLHKPLPVRS